MQTFLNRKGEGRIKKQSVALLFLLTLIKKEQEICISSRKRIYLNDVILPYRYKSMKEKSTPSGEETIISFLAFFNEIDKHFDKILGEEGFSPYNEKLKKIAEGNYSITGFVRKHLYQLRNF